MAQAQQAIPDLVSDSKLEVDVFPDHVIHSDYVSNPSTGQRRTRIEERWENTRTIGRGSFGVVSLQTCTTGPPTGQVRALKELWKGEVAGPSVINYVRELEALAKFSQKKVGVVVPKPKRMQYGLGWLTLGTVSRLLCPLLWMVRDHRLRIHHHGVPGIW
jgi:hypothetical protein